MHIDNRVKKLLLIVILIFTILFIISLKINISTIFNACILIFLAFGIFIDFVVFKSDSLIQKLKSIFVVVLVAILSLIPVYFLHNEYYKSSSITQEQALTFYGEYITFLGAFCLGYFIYKKDENHRIEEKKSQCKLLDHCIQKSETDMLRLARHNYKLDKIFYDNNWREYYFNFELLTKRKYTDTLYTINEFFDTVELINLCLDKSDYDRAKKIFEDHVTTDCCSIRKYNLMETKLIIQEATYINETSLRIKHISWENEPKTKKIIKEYSQELFGLVENYIYNYMIKSNKSVIKDSEVDNLIIDWLLTNPHIKEIAKWPSDKRIVAKIIFNIALQLDTKSKRISHCWDEYSMKTIEINN